MLFARGFHDAGAARPFLCPSLDDLHDPLKLRGMDCALERLTRAIRNREKILIYGDYDVDGTTSVVILKRAIEIKQAARRISTFPTGSGTATACGPKWWKQRPGKAFL